MSTHSSCGRHIVISIYNTKTNNFIALTVTHSITDVWRFWNIWYQFIWFFLAEWPVTRFICCCIQWQPANLTAEFARAVEYWRVRRSLSSSSSSSSQSQDVRRHRRDSLYGSRQPVIFVSAFCNLIRELRIPHLHPFTSHYRIYVNIVLFLVVITKLLCKTTATVNKRYTYLLLCTRLLLALDFNNLDFNNSD